ncbi:MAG: hypothetical protein HY054_14585 [Proteobacteria bacterium]|nr:hypothetical protein [Pseudomonadota bacterium]
MLKMFAIAASAWLMCLANASAQEVPAEAADDLHCAVIGMQLVGDPASDPQAKQAGTMITIFYVGRLQGRAPGVDLERPILDYERTLTVDRVNAERQRCAAEFRQVGVDLQDLGQRLSAHETGQTH